ncbi:MAG: (2Fe-2S) ferredoxin domain-containing protein [Oculatellaceae cyanobacterium Prado106]|jgi:(2Fe-2S) ferredoxin|nr:(2Fe-2S) ferredoxin domain-containing protein [Oculatellaceae cyanobacterium Prado106]
MDSLASASSRFVLVCQHRSCARNQSADVLAAFQALAPEGVLVAATDCMGQCASGPTVQVAPEGIWYCRVTAKDVAEIVEQHLGQQQPVQRLLHPRFHFQWQGEVE